MFSKRMNISLKCLQYSGLLPFNYNKKSSKFEKSRRLSLYIKFLSLLLQLVHIFTVSYYIVFLLNYYNLLENRFEMYLLIAIYIIFVIYGAFIGYKFFFHIPNLILLSNEILGIHNKIPIQDYQNLLNGSAIFIFNRLILLPHIVIIVDTFFYSSVSPKISLIQISCIVIKIQSSILIASIIPPSLVVKFFTFVLKQINGEIAISCNSQRIYEYSSIFKSSMKTFNKFMRFYQFHIIFHEITISLGFMYELYALFDILFFHTPILQQIKLTNLVLYRITNFSFILFHLISFATIIDRLFNEDKKLARAVFNLQIIMKYDTETRREVSIFSYYSSILKISNYFIFQIENFSLLILQQKYQIKPLYLHKINNKIVYSVNNMNFNLNLNVY